MRLPVYTPRQLAWETSAQKALDRGCSACGRAGQLTRCLGPGQRPGTGRKVLVLLSRASADDAGAGRLGTTGASGFVYSAVCQAFPPDTHVVIDVALRCSGNDETETEVSACRPYSAAVMRGFKPDLVLACGDAAVRALTGETADVRAVSRGWAVSGDGTPIVVMLDEASAWANGFVRERFVRDLCWVASTTADTFVVKDWQRELVTRENVAQAIAELRAAPWCSWDTEYAGLAFDGPHYFEVLTHGLAAVNGHAVWVWHGAALRDPEVSEPLYQLLEDPTVALVAQDAKADLVAMASPEPTTGRRPVYATNIVGDPLLIRHLQDPDVHADLALLGYLVGRGVTKGVLEQHLAQAQTWIGHVRKVAKTGQFIPGIQHPAYEQAVRHPRRNFKAFAHALIPVDALVEYQATDTATTADLGAKLLQDAETDPVVREGWKILRPLPEVAARMEASGLAVDLGRLQSFESYLRVREQGINQHMRLVTQGADLNPHSDDSVGSYLYGKLGLPILDYTDTGKPSVAAEVLEKLEQAHPVVPLILASREVGTYLSRYAVGMRRHVRADGRIHPRFNLDGTRTGRWSSADPNFQNLAEHGEMAKLVKRYLVAQPGYVLMGLDFSQVEYVTASVVSGDEVMQQIFKDGKDMHRRTAELVGPLLWSRTTEEMAALSSDEIKTFRQKAKAINFGALFNMQASTLARQLGCSEQEAAKLLNAILYELFSRFAAWRDNEIKMATQRGYTQVYSITESGDLIPVRRRPLVGLASNSRRVVGNAINASVNTPVQGSASIIQAKAIVAVDTWLRETGLFQRGLARIVNAIHDATYLEVHESLVHEVHGNVEPRMVNQPTRGVPLRVDCKVGRDLASMVDISEWAA